MEDEVIFKSHQQGEPCEGLKSLVEKKGSKITPEENPAKKEKGGKLKAFTVLRERE